MAAKKKKAKSALKALEFTNEELSKALTLKSLEFLDSMPLIMCAAFHLEKTGDIPDVMKHSLVAYRRHYLKWQATHSITAVPDLYRIHREFNDRANKAAAEACSKNPDLTVYVFRELWCATCNYYGVGRIDSEDSVNCPKCGNKFQH